MASGPMASGGEIGPRAARSWWRRHRLALGSGVAVVLLAGLGLVLHRVAGVAPASPGPALSGRAFSGPALNDSARRGPVSDTDLQRAVDVQARLRLSLVYPTRILENRPAGRTGPEVDDVRRGLSAAGFPDATVRPATAGDPAPPGSVIYAVRVGDACLIGYETGPELNFSSSSIGGLRRDGSCLGR
jgi:hypothetical protein